MIKVNNVTTHTWVISLHVPMFDLQCDHRFRFNHSPECSCPNFLSDMEIGPQPTLLPS